MITQCDNSTVIEPTIEGWRSDYNYTFRRLDETDTTYYENIIMEDENV